MALKSAAAVVKLKLMDMVCKPSLSYRCSRWPPQQQVAKELDRMQSKMVACIMRIKRAEGAALTDYCRRRNRQAAAVCRKTGVWSCHWFSRAIKWDEHLARGHSENSWPVLLRQFHGAIWLEIHRSLTNLHGTGTRVSRGRPQKRWSEGIQFAQRFAWDDAGSFRAGPLGSNTLGAMHLTSDLHSDIAQACFS